MPLSNEEINQLEKVEKNTNTKHRSKVIQFLCENPEYWYYIDELADKTNSSRSTVISAVNNNQQYLREKHVKHNNRNKRYIKYQQQK